MPSPHSGSDSPDPKRTRPAAGPVPEEEGPGAEEELGAKEGPGAEEESGAEDEDDVVELDLPSSLIEHTVTDSFKTLRSENEDRVINKTTVNVEHLLDSAAGVCFGVVDGHGGSSCADYIKKNFATNLVSCLNQVKTGKNKTKDLVALTEISMKQAFNMTEVNFFNIAKKNYDPSGACMCVAALVGPDEQGYPRLTVGNLGDCRALLCRDGQAISLSTDHKISDPVERERIQKAGGVCNQFFGVWRVGCPCDPGRIAPESAFVKSSTPALKRQNMGLAVARAMGDISFKQPRQLVSPVPDVSTTLIDFETDEFILMCSDGVFDVMSSQEAVDCIRGPFLDYALGVRQLLKAVKQRGGTDDTTVQLIELTPFSDAKKKQLKVGSGYTVICDPLKRNDTEPVGDDQWHECEEEAEAPPPPPEVKSVVEEEVDMFA